MDKFGRRYQLDVQGVDGTIVTVELPFTLEFDITRNFVNSANVSSIRVLNLSERTRNNIRKDYWNLGDLRTITLKAGYEGMQLSTIFQGNMSQAWSVREGVDFVTQMESFDNSFAYVQAQTNVSFPKGTKNRDMISQLAKSIPNSSIGAIGSFPGELARGASYAGNTAEILNDLTHGGFFIDNGKVYCLSDSECVVGQITVIDSSTGLLGTPVREQTYINFDILFEPRLDVGQKIELNSQTEKSFNGVYKVVSIKHRGMISDTVCGQAVTSVGLFNPGAPTLVANGG